MSSTPSTPLRDAKGDDPGLTPEVVRQHMANILGSNTFGSAALLRKFLEFVVKETLSGRAHDIAGKRIGVVLWGSHYDPNGPNVRLVAGKVRQRLLQYYAGEGAGEAIRIEIPKGQYACRFVLAGPRSASRGQSQSTGATGHGNRLAVLPLLSALPACHDADLGRKVAAVLIDLLGPLKAVSVVAQTSSFQFENQAVDVHRIADKLQVDWLVEGTICILGGDLTTTVRLIAAVSAAAVWTAQFRSDAEDMAFVRNIARALEEELQRRMSRPSPKS